MSVLPHLMYQASATLYVSGVDVVDGSAVPGAQTLSALEGAKGD